MTSIRQLAAGWVALGWVALAIQVPVSAQAATGEPEPPVFQSDPEDFGPLAAAKDPLNSPRRRGPDDMRKGRPGPPEGEPGFPRPGPGRFHGHRRALTEDQIDEALDFLKEHWPERHALMKQLREQDPEAFGLAFRNIWPQLARMLELAREDPELAAVEVALVKIEFAMLRAMRAYHAAVSQEAPGPDGQGPTTQSANSEADKQLEELRSLIGQRFDLQLKRSELRIQALSRQLKQQQERLEQHRQQKEEEVDKALKQLISKRFSPRRLRGLLSPSDKFPDRRRLDGWGGGRKSGRFKRDLPRRDEPTSTEPTQ